LSFITKGYNLSQIFDTYSANSTFAESPLTLEIWDTAGITNMIDNLTLNHTGADDYNQLALLSYPSTDVFLVCFSVVDPSSIQNVEEKVKIYSNITVLSYTTIVGARNYSSLSWDAISVGGYKG